jgi:hypothetical protein
MMTTPTRIRTMPGIPEEVEAGPELMAVAIGCVVPLPPSEYAPDPVDVRPSGADCAGIVAVVVPPGVVPVGVAELAGVVVVGAGVLAVVVVVGAVVPDVVAPPPGVRYFL